MIWRVQRMPVADPVVLVVESYSVTRYRAPAGGVLSAALRPEAIVVVASEGVTAIDLRGRSLNLTELAARLGDAETAIDAALQRALTD